MRKSLLLFIFASCLFNSCDDTFTNDIITTHPNNPPSNRSAFDNYFDWDRINDIETINPFTHTITTMGIPWKKGSSNNLGIPSTWLDENASDPIYANRYYSRENGWELIYSNITESTPTKYFALYHKYTGLLRFFFYEIASSAGLGSSEAFWGIRTDKSTSLFNFMEEISIPINRSEKSSYIASTEGTFLGNEFVSSGYKANNWYGLEIECAYDPSLNTQSLANFEIRGWAVNKIKTTGMAQTSGDITGTIVMNTTNISNFNFNLANTFNNSKTSIAVNQEGFINTVSKEIENGITKKDSFWKSIGNSIKGATVSDIKNGLKALVTSGGSAAVSALKGLAGSIIGINKSKPSIGQIDLKINTNTQMQFESEQTTTGWGSISSFPVAGTTNNNNDVPIYNFPLGVWNLKKSPQIIRNVEGEIGMYYDAGYFTYEYEVGDYEILVNPVVSQEYRVYSKANLLFKSNSYASAPPFGYINEMKYYGGGSSFSTDILKGDSSDKHFHAHYPIKKDDLLIHLYVELINKNNPDIKFSFSKYFATGDIIEGTSNIEEIDDREGPITEHY